MKNFTCSIVAKTLSTKPLLTFLLFLGANSLWAQKDAIFKKDSTEIRCKILRIGNTKYTFAYTNANNRVIKAHILKSLVDSVVLNKYGSNLVVIKRRVKATIVATENAPLKPLKFTMGIGLNLGNVLEFNSPSGADKKSFSLNCALDLGMDYAKESSRFAMTNELHWTVGFQKQGLTNATHIQRSTDDLSTLHDFSVALNKSNKWSLNVIAKTNTCIFTIYDGDYFKDFNSNGKTQAFLSPYEVTISPGLKYQPNKYFRVSVSPYSMRLYGLASQQIANTGYYTQTFDENNNYDLFVYKQLGAELNVWYDRRFKKWLEMQYRVGISSDYFSKIAKNGLLNGLFITKIKIIKNVSLTHRAILKADFTMKPFKPYYNQTVLLSYAKSF